MTGPPPKQGPRHGRSVPQRGDWKAAPGLGWQHGPIPDPPDGLFEESKVAWRTWMQSWIAAFWTPVDLPGLFALIRLYDQCLRTPDHVSLASERRQLMDTYGITPKGQQDRRWKPPDAAIAPTAPSPKSRSKKTPYGHLKVVDG